MNALERPNTAQKATLLAEEDEMDENGKERWLSEKEDKLADLSVLESKAYNLSRELKVKAKT